MQSFSERFLDRLRAVFRPRPDLELATLVLPNGWIKTPDYHGPDRRVVERRTQRERRINPRVGMGWWRSRDRRAGGERRRASIH